MQAEDYEFTVDWFSQFAGVWRALFQQFLPGAKKVLEIGSYEGRSTTWLIENAFLPHAAGDLYCIDTWQGSMENDRSAMPEVERRFDRNVAKAKERSPGIRVYKIKGASQAALKRLSMEGHGGAFDFVYVDGSHQAADVLSDLVLAFELCRVGGLIACDDYLWNFGQNPLLTPKLAIDAFINCFAGKVVPVLGPPLQQLYLQKKAD